MIVRILILLITEPMDYIGKNFCKMGFSKIMPSWSYVWQVLKHGFLFRR